MERDSAQLANDVLQAVVGTKNVKSVLHCMTGLRFTLADDSVVDDDAVKAIDGVLGIAKQGGQYQVIIGTTVPEVYDAVVAAGAAAGGVVDEQLDDVKEKKSWTPKSIGNAVLDYISGTVVPLIPVLIAGAFFKTAEAIVGPNLLGLVAADSDFIFICEMGYNAAFWFMPIVAGFSAAKKLGVNPFLGAFMGAMLMEPSFAKLAADGVSSISFLGIPAPVATYGQTLIPVLICVAVLAPIERFFERVLPESIRTMFAPFFTMAIMLPLGLIVLAPLGNWMGQGIAYFIEWLGSTPFRPVAVMLVSGLWAALVIAGMHLGLAAIALAQFATAGTDTLVLMAANAENFVATAVGLAIFFRMRTPSQKADVLGYVITQFFGGVGEPLLFGVHMRYKNPVDRPDRRRRCRRPLCLADWRHPLLSGKRPLHPAWLPQRHERELHQWLHRNGHRLRGRICRDLSCLPRSRGQESLAFPLPAGGNS
ncbi:MAG: PTS transporter subunit EIIC [Atopobiaceae bacterium]|jgi:PTS system beta-glucosides-specific IIC component|nr:PTS transporter subunit EIIC [Atopobiaceae bacterium]